MKKYLNELWLKFKNLKGIKRIVTYFLLLLYVFVLVVSLVKVNYSVVTPGTIAPVSSLISIDEEYDKDPIYTVAIYEYRRVSILHYWLSLANPNVEVNKFSSELELSNKDDKIAGELMKQASITNSIIMAYNEASLYHEDINIDYTFNGLVVVMLNRLTDPSLKLGDIIVKIEGEDITSYNQFKIIALSKLEDLEIDKINMTILSDDNTQVDISIKIVEKIDNGIKYRSLQFTAYEDYTINHSTPEYDVKDNDSGGPSGGLMQAVAIYNAITKDSLASGKRIVGTGTIDAFGNVGAIGGIKQKIITANMYGADYFFVPSSNYDEAMEQYNKLKNPHFSKPIKVDSFAEVISFLQALKEN